MVLGIQTHVRIDLGPAAWKATALTLELHLSSPNGDPNPIGRVLAGTGHSHLVALQC